SQVSERSNVRQAQREAVLIFIAYGSQGQPAELYTYTAAIPVVTALDGGVLQELIRNVESNIRGSADPTLVRIAVPDQPAKLVEFELGRRRIRILWGRRDGNCFAHYAHIGRASGDEELFEMVRHVCSTRIDLAGDGIVVQMPVDIGILSRLNTHSRNDGRKTSGSGEECDTREFGRSREDVLLSWHQRATESGIHKILLDQFPAENFVPWSATGVRHRASGSPG